MATTTSKLGLQLPADGEPGWGAMCRANFSKLDQVAAGQNLPKVLTGGTYTLSATEGGYDSFEFSGVLTANQVVVVPNNMPVFAVENLMSGPYTLTIKTALGAGVIVDQGSISLMYCNGVNCEYLAGLQKTVVVNTTGGTTTLTKNDLAGGSIEVTGALTSNATIIIPNITYPFTVEDTTTGNFDVIVKTAAGLSATIPIGLSLMYANGTNAELVYGPVAAQLISTATTVVAATPTKVALAAIAANNYGITPTTATSRMVCVNKGLYHFIGKVAGTCTAAAQSLTLQAYKNGVLIPAAAAPKGLINNESAVAGGGDCMIDFFVSMVAGDYVELFATGTVASGFTLGIGQSSLSARKV